MSKIIQRNTGKLEQFCKTNPNDAPSHFVLAYHDLVTVPKTPRSMRCGWSSRISRKFHGPGDVDVVATGRTAVAAAPAGYDLPETDLVGNWCAKAGNTTIDLAITEDSQFTWKANQAGKPPVELKGELSATADGLDLHSAQSRIDGRRSAVARPRSVAVFVNRRPPSDPGSEV